MKKMMRCPKCAGKRIWVIEKYRVPGESAEGRELCVLPHQEEGKGGLLSFGRLNPVGHFDLFLCDGCGYSELWADGFRGLTPDPARGIRLLDTDAKAGPFR
jgi:predicted nucleic-acid-binding Zn-ribbon protein